MTVKDTEITIEKRSGNIFRKSKENISSIKKDRTIILPSINEKALAKQRLHNMELEALTDSLTDVNSWLNNNIRTLLYTDDGSVSAWLQANEDKTRSVGTHTFWAGMVILITTSILLVVIFFWLWHIMNQFLKADKRNKSLIENRRNMMYSIVHDLRTPLSIVIGYNDMAKQCPTKNEKYISAISFSARQLREMIDQLLDYFRLESNKGMLKPRDFSLMELANELTNSFELRADERLIEFVKPKVQGIVLNGDYEKICHIATNLLDNAFKFTRKGSVELDISYADDMLNIKVSDTGIGIKDEDKERVFSAFTRFSNAVATGKEGFGIGLSTAKMLVDLMKGKIDFESSDKGTTFYVSLPMKIAESKGDAVVAEVMKASEERKRVLVVDDSNVWLLMIQGVLQQNGFDCDVCSDTAKFFTMLRKGNYSAVIMDLQMPGKNGRELLNVMRESKVANSQTVPVIVSTASGEEVREELLKVGFDEYLPKTADISEMVNVVNQVIAEKSKTVTPDFSKLRKSVAGYLIEETEDAVAGLHNAVKTMDFDEMRKWAHCLKTSWLLYRVSILVDPIMEVARSKDMNAYNRLVSYMAEIDKMAKIIITKAKEIRGHEG